MKKLFLLLGILFTLTLNAQFNSFYFFDYQSSNIAAHSYYMDSVFNQKDIERWDDPSTYHLYAKKFYLDSILEIDSNITNILSIGSDRKVKVTPKSYLNLGTVSSVGLTSSDLTISGSPITTSGTFIADLNTSGVAAGKYDWVNVNNKGIVTGGGNMTTPTAMTTKSFNTAYQVSSTVYSRIWVSANISANLSISGGQDGSIILEISANGTSGWIYMGQIDGSNTGTLTIGLNTTQKTGGQLTADLPIGYYWRLRTVSNTGSPTFTWNGGNYITY